MKSLFSNLLYWLIAGVLFYSGCELVTKEPEFPTRRSGDDLILNELYTLSPDKYYAFTWIELFNPVKRTVPWFSATFPAGGVSVGSSGAGVRTEDDGALWSALNIGNSNEEYHGITMQYTDTALVVGYDGTQGIVRRLTFDSVGTLAAVQNVLSPTTRSINAISFRSMTDPTATSKAGYIACDRGQIFRTTNSCQSWQLQNVVPATTKNLHSLALVDFTHIWVCGDSGTVIKRTSASAWTPQTLPEIFATTNFYGIFFSDDTGWAVGENGAIAHTRSGGATAPIWLPESSGVSTTLRGGFSGYTTTTQAYFKRGRAWVCGDGGLIIRTDDNGRHWYRQSSNTSSKLNSIVFTDSLRGWAFGDNGTVINTTDGGERWRSQTSNSTANLFGGVFIFPPTTAILNYYQLSMLAQKKHFFFDPVTGLVNFDFIVRTDTGIVHFVNFFNGLGRGIPQSGFAIINNDSTKFKDHFKLGPGSSDIVNFSIGFDSISLVTNTEFRTVTFNPVNPVLWSLLSSGEVRLVKNSGQFELGTGKIVRFTTKVLDEIRYGNYKPAPSDPFYDPNYVNDDPLGPIPDGWSIARYANDLGSPTPAEHSTRKSFYMTNSPIPGWFSQEERK
ncbi:MAG TPA: YCF48-related protein [Bacteroidota bacterium]|nr:YCF48-related protein [Bacteroidota bacterium]